MGAKSGIKWNGVSVGTQPTLDVIGANVQLILRDPKTQQEWVTTSQDYANFLVDNGIISSGGWGLTGNAGTDYTVNFIGTTDDEPLVLKSNNATLLEINESTNAFYISSYDQLLDPALQSGVEIVATNGGTNLRLRCKVNDVATGNIDISDTLSFYTAGIERVIIDNSGNVGIGTGTPTSLLTVEDGDIEITNKNNGLIVYSQDGTAWRVGVSDLGVVTATAV
jgi:hypothetical protein